MKTSLSGSRRGASSRQAARAAATSGLSCSAACRLFFEGDGVAVEEPPDRARRKRGTLLIREQLGNLDKGQIGLLFDRIQDELAMRLDAVRTLVTALPLGRDRAASKPLLDKTHRTRRRYPKPLRSRAARHAAIDRPNDPNPQIFRQGLRHVCWPPRPAHRVNQNFSPRGIPFDSIRSDFALALPIVRRRKDQGPEHLVFRFRRI